MTCTAVFGGGRRALPLHLLARRALPERPGNCAAFEAEDLQHPQPICDCNFLGLLLVRWQHLSGRAAHVARQVWLGGWGLGVRLVVGRRAWQAWQAEGSALPSTCDASAPGSSRRRVRACHSHVGTMAPTLMHPLTATPVWRRVCPVSGASIGPPGPARSSAVRNGPAAPERHAIESHCATILCRRVDVLTRCRPLHPLMPAGLRLEGPRLVAASPPPCLQPAALLASQPLSRTSRIELAERTCRTPRMAPLAATHCLVTTSDRAR